MNAPSAVGLAAKRIGLVLVTIVVPLLIAEVGIRLVDLVRGDGFFASPRNVIARTKRVSLPFRTFGIEPYTQVDGVTFITSRHAELYPIEKPEGTLRIVCFGGSTTVNDYSQSRGTGHYPLLLQEILRERLDRPVEVINAAFSSYATPHSLILFALDVLSWDPDIVIMTHNYNDLSTTFFPDFTYSYSNKYGSSFFMPQRHSAMTELVFQHFQLFWAIRARLQSLVVNLTHSIKRESFGPEPSEDAAAIFRRNLRSFIALAKTSDIEVVLGTQALEASEDYFDAHALAKPYNYVIRYPLHQEFVQHHHFYNHVMQEVAQEEGVWFVDNEAVMGGERKYFVDHVHYTSLGVKQLAENYAKELISQLGTEAPNE